MTVGHDAEASSLLAHLLDRAEPDAPALVASDRAPLSFAALAQTIDDLAACLTALGYGDADVIAVLSPPGPETAVAILGTAETATAAPLDPRLTLAECTAALQQMGAVAVLGPATLDAPGWHAADAVGLPRMRWTPEGIEAGRLRVEGDAPGRRRRASDDGGGLAGGLIVRTSGTSSSPKLVPLDRRQILMRSLKAARLLDLGPGDRGLNLMPLCYIHGLHSGLSGPLSAGGSVICPAAFERNHFLEALESLGPTWYTAGASHQRTILGWLRSTAPVRHELRFARSSAAPLDASAHAELEERLGVPVVVGYGASEAGAITANPPNGSRKPGTVGVTTDGDVSVVDEEGRALPAGIVGEVVVSGPTVFAGYLGDPEATRSALRGGGFHTGDLGWLDEDGYLTLVGRSKDVINRGGEMVSLAEVDAQVLTHPSVAAAATFSIPHPRLGEDVAVAVQYRPGAETSADELRAFLRERLTSFKVPRRIVAVDVLPLGPTGKPARNELTERYGSALDVGIDDDVPDERMRSHEDMLRDLWAAVLDLDAASVGRQDDFFELGGDSLAAAELLDRIEVDLGAGLSFDALIENPTVRGMAARLMDDAWLSRHALRVPGTLTMNAAGTRPPLFVVSGRYGHPMRLVPVSRVLGDEQPVVALQPPGLDWDALGCRTVEEMAAYYVEQIREVAPIGPYHLLGTSFGGLIVFEIALILQRDGDRVELLVLLDTAVPAVESGPLEPPVRDEQVRVAHRRIADVHRRARKAYVIREQFDGELVLVVCTGNLLRPGDGRAPWGAAATGGTRVLLVPGPHARLDQEPQTREVGRTLQACLRGDRPDGIETDSVFERSFILEPGRLIRDDGVIVPIAPHAAHGTFEVAVSARGWVHVTGQVESVDRDAELVVFADGRYAGWIGGVAVVDFAVPDGARRSVRIFVLAADGREAAELAPPGQKVLLRERLRAMLARSRSWVRQR